ncbi:MAG: YtxH domain-containing protein [Armatimonadota bacterium]|nr:YtxH domain-containing protein [Armatimonadota bacterium]
MNDSEDRDITLNLLAGIGIGAIIGAVTALLLAPKSGVETREDIKGAVDDIKRKSEELMSDWSAAMDEQLQRSKKLYDEARAKVQQALDAGKKAVSQKKEELTGEAQPEGGEA